MHLGIYHLNKNTNATISANAAYSFSAFAKDLRKRLETEKTLKSEFYKLILERFDAHPELEQRLSPQEASRYQDILELIYAVISPAIVDENEYYWAIGSPIPGDIIYYTESFRRFITSYHANKNSIINQDENTFKERQEDFFYRMVLEQLYNLSSNIRNDVIYTQVDEARNLERYFKIHIDTKYVEVTAKQPLPELNPELIEQFLHEGAGHEVLTAIIPLDMFAVNGFSIITVEDITAEHSIELIKFALVDDSANPNELFTKVSHNLQTLTNHSSIEFGLLPFLKVNGNLVFDTEECFSSVLINSLAEQQVSPEVSNAAMQEYITNPRAIFFNEIKESKIKDNISLRTLYNAGIKSYAVLPVYFNHKLTGAMEIYSKKGEIHFERLLSKLEAAVPLLSQLLHNSIEQFNNRIENVIKEKFTTLQQSVEWKFNEAAWNYLKNQDSGKDEEIRAISFKDVYPLYGAIDIRNSTIMRNAALLNDLNTVLDKLTVTLEHVACLKDEIDFKKQAETVQAWKVKINKQIGDNDEMHIKAFVESEIYPVFDELKGELPAAAKIINDYFAALDEKEGEAYTRRRELERSMSLINSALNNYFEAAQHKLQKIYPCYFEKFRTDGVEYDIYTGQSIAPNVPFDSARISKFRRWQLMSMIDIVKITDKLTEKMDCKLSTTQLIFVHSNPIDICFRKDERRFDVEGAYNIRYEIIKKRIDKVLIKNTDERLTQPGQIAMVYSDVEEADEFLLYIDEARKNNLITGETEFHDLEELQGVLGLKAIRLTVNLQA